MKFLFCSLDSPGFLHPSIGLARGLQARGHEVAFVTHERHAGRLADLGLPRLPRGSTDGASFEVGQWGQPLSIAIQVKHIEHALGSFEADVLVGQALTFGPLIVGERRGLPVGLLGFCTYLWPTADGDGGDRGEPALSPQSPVAEWRAWRHRGMVETLNKARALFRLGPRAADCRESPLLGDLFLLRSVPALEPAWEELPPRVHLVGACDWEPEEADPELEAWLADAARGDAPVIYAQPGRSFHLPGFWSGLTGALGGGDFRVAAAVERLDGGTGPVPESFLVRPHIPQGKVLRHARAVVASANSTAVLGALAAGVPLLLVPGGGEQPDVAALCRSVGVARILAPEEATSERIRDEIRTLLADPIYRESARRYAAAFREVNGVERAVELLEELARSSATGRVRGPLQA